MKNNYGSTLFIFITNNCNLKCLGCMQSCDRITNPYYITKKEFISNLKELQKKDFTINGRPIQTIHLTGGDPLTHPDWKEFCKLIHIYLPNLYIDISTNGLLLNKLTDEEIIYLNKEYNVVFQISLYPTLSLMNMYKKLIKRFKDLNITLTIGGSSHFFFSKQDKIKKELNNNDRDFNQQCQKMLNNQDHVILYKGKIYSCWKDINILQKETILNDNAYDLFNNPPTELIQNKKHYYCNLCKNSDGAGGEEFILWQHHNKQAKEIFNYNLKDLYLYNYNLYYSLQHDCNNIDILKDELFQKYLSDNEKRYANTRFLNGKGDIFIPFTNNIPSQLKVFLNSIESIEQYNIYFISVKAIPEIEEKVYNIFLPFNREEKLNNYFLKANNLFNAYTTFLNNSYLSNKFIIDIEQNNFELLPLQN